MADATRVIACRPVAEQTYELTLSAPEIAGSAQPGQFVHLKAPGGEDLLMRRPISLYTADVGTGTVSFIIQRKGEGTARLCAVKPGDTVDALGPLGRGFHVPQDARRVAVVGGGIGVAPLRLVLERYREATFDSFVGFRNANCAYGLEVFTALSHSLYCASDDGSLGTRGFVTDLLAKEMDQQPYDLVLACGPKPMFQALARVMEGHPDIPCQVSLEERMGCGIGGCYVCSCKIREGNAWHYRRVCKDGPVFELREVDWT